MRVAFGVIVKDGRNSMAAAKNVGMRHRRIEKGSEALENAWRRANLRQSRVPHERDATVVVDKEPPTEHPPTVTA